MKKRVFEIILWLITVAFIVGIYFMPEIVPIHWNTNWQVDSYGSRYYLIILAIMPVLIYYGMLLTRKVDPRRENIERRGKTYDLFRYGLTCFFIVLVAFFYYLTLNPHGPMKLPLFALLGIMLIGIGNYLPKVPQNYFLGIKTPWTLSNEYVWQKTHKVGGYSFMLAGVIIALYGIFNLPYEYIVIIVVLLVDVVFTFVYSYLIYKKVESNDI